MARYADPHHCPDCGTDLDWTHRQEACPVCRLPLMGRAPADLYASLAYADTILAFMQAERLPITVDAAPLTTGLTELTTVPTLPGETPSRPAPWQPLPRSAPAPRRVRLGVPALLLGLGALCILVAAVVFLAIAWSVLGVAGRTSVLVGLTVAAGVLTALFTRKDLRAAAETLGVLGLALFSFDLTGARASGWFGPVETLRFVTLAAGVVVVAGAVSTLALRRLGPALTGLQVVGSLAYVASALAGVLDAGERRAAVGLAVVLLVSIVAVAAARRFELAPLSWGPLLVAVVSAVGLVLIGVERTLSDNVRHTTSWSAMWPLLLVAALAAGLAAVGSRDATLRALVNAGATLLVVFAVVVPHLHGLEAFTVAASVLLVLCGTAALARVDSVTLTARLVGVVAVGVAGVGTATYLGGLLATSLGAVEHTDLWELGATAVLPAPPDLVSGWAVVFAVVAAAATHVLVTLADPDPDPDPGPRDRVAGAALAWLPAVSAAAAVAVCGYQPTLAVACLALVAGSAAPAAVAIRGAGTHRTACAGGAAVLLAAAAVISLAAASVTVGVWVVGLAAGLLLVREAREEVAAPAAAWVPCAVAVTTGAIGHLSGVSVRVNGLVVLVVLAGVVLALPWLPGAGREGVRRSVLAAALLAAGAATLAGVEHTRADSQLLWLAVYLTLSGAAAAAVGIRDRDRVAVLVGTVLMLGATWVRLVDTGVETVEAYTGPVALVLAAVGLHALLTRPDVRTPGALGPALGVALLPSLLLVVDDPLSLRALVLGLACLVLVGVGVSLRWSAALLYGAAVGAVVVVIEVAPLGQGVPRWVLIGSVGAALLVAGTTWEHLVVSGRRVWSQVSALR